MTLLRKYGVKMGWIPDISEIMRNSNIWAGLIFIAFLAAAIYVIYIVGQNEATHRYDRR